jgi:hypothetical protein
MLCVVHAWNNGVGKRDVDRRDLIRTSETMPRGAFGPQGFSPDVLVKWATKFRAHEFEIVQGVERFATQHQLLRILSSNTRTKCLLVSVIVANGGYSHMIAITKDCLWMDSELDKPYPVRDIETFNCLFARYTHVRAVRLVLDGPRTSNSTPDVVESYDLTGDDM